MAEEETKMKKQENGVANDHAICNNTPQKEVQPVKSYGTEAGALCVENLLNSVPAL